MGECGKIGTHTYNQAVRLLIESDYGDTNWQCLTKLKIWHYLWYTFGNVYTFMKWTCVLQHCQYLQNSGNNLKVK